VCDFDTEGLRTSIRGAGGRGTLAAAIRGGKVQLDGVIDQDIADVLSPGADGAQGRSGVLGEILLLDCNGKRMGVIVFMREHCASLLDMHRARATSRILKTKQDRTGHAHPPNMAGAYRSVPNPVG
jgi:hypothetical protein